MGHHKDLWINNGPVCSDTDGDDGIFGQGSGIYHTKEMDINRTTTIDDGKEGGCIGDKFFTTSTPSLRYHTGKNVHSDPDNINTDIHIYIYILSIL
jgi:hypothetical protein